MEISFSISRRAERENKDLKETIEAARKQLLLVTGYICRHDRASRGSHPYCSGCPCSAIGTEKNQLTYEESKKLCTLRREYPK